jgi:hypothetical protein
MVFRRAMVDEVARLLRDTEAPLPEGSITASTGRSTPRSGLGFAERPRVRRLTKGGHPQGLA